MPQLVVLSPPNQLCIVADVNVIPMVSRDRPSILHLLPRSPRLNRISRCLPNLLSPNHILDTQRRMVTHHPLSKRTPSFSPNPTGLRTHKIRRQTTAMIARRMTIARTVARAVNLAHRPRIPLDDFARRIDGPFLACSHRRERWGGIVAIAATSAAGLAALEGRGPGTLVGNGCSRTGIGEATVAASATVRLGAAFDVSGGAWAGVADEFATGFGAACGRDTYAGCTSFAIAWTVDY